MAQESGTPGQGAAHKACPLQCRLRGDTGRAHPDDAHDRVDWAGLPINLDLVFSQEKCDKVYVQHLMRRRETQLWRWSQDGAEVCVCHGMTDQGGFQPDAARLISGL